MEFLRRHVLGGMRRTEEILDTEQEMFDRVWYDRKLVLIHTIRQGEDTIDPEIRKGMFAAMRKVRERYGTDSLQRMSKFDCGMLNGKLSALRWVDG